MWINNLIISRLPKRITFKYWLDLESAKEKFFTAAESGRDEFPNLVLNYLSAAVGFKWWWKQLYWQDVFEVVNSVSNRTSPPRSIPLLRDIPTGDNQQEVDWNYENRTWHYWSHLLANAYGWTLEYIAGLDVVAALLQVQEILTSQQLDREFSWSLSEIAYPYDSGTKKQNFKSMPRPYWMRPAQKPVVVTKMRREFMPMGMVENASGMTNDIIKAQEAKSASNVEGISGNSILPS